MLAYDLLKKFEAMPQELREYCLQSYLASLGMDLEGFRDSAARPQFSFAKFALLRFGEAMLMTERNSTLPEWSGDRVIPMPIRWSDEVADEAGTLSDKSSVKCTTGRQS